MSRLRVRKVKEIRDRGRLTRLCREKTERSCRLGLTLRQNHRKTGLFDVIKGGWRMELRDYSLCWSRSQGLKSGVLLVVVVMQERFKSPAVCSRGFRFRQSKCFVCFLVMVVLRVFAKRAGSRKLLASRCFFTVESNIIAGAGDGAGPAFCSLLRGHWPRELPPAAASQCCGRLFWDPVNCVNKA